MAYGRSDIRQGTTVYDRNNEKIGGVETVAAEYFTIQTGFLGLGGQHKIPFDAVSRVTQEGIYVNAAKDRLDDIEWSEQRRTGAPMTGTRGGSTFEGREQTMPLREEELEAHRRTERAGEVTVGKDVVEEHRRMSVPYTEERAYVERRPVQEHEASGRIGDEEGTITVPIREEEVEVTKRPVVKEELVIHKEEVQREKDVDETVRKEVPRVSKEGDVRDIGERGLSDEERRRRESR